MNTPNYLPEPNSVSKAEVAERNFKRGGFGFGLSCDIMKGGFDREFIIPSRYTDDELLIDRIYADKLLRFSFKLPPFPHLDFYKI
jgi:hypothetical protein